MPDLVQILQDFQPISLSEMDRVKLMNRTDTKFNFNRFCLAPVLTELMDYYRIVDIENRRIMRYETLYYDTDTLRLYITHQNGKLGRFKVRHRTYVNSNTGFLEVKIKTNKGRTIKERIKEPVPPTAWDEKESDFLNRMLPFDASSLKPTLWVNYSRITLVNKDSPERVTLDLNLEFVSGTNKADLSELVIAEVKQEKRQTSPFVRVMKNYHIREGGISKYCLGVTLINEKVKKNNFKGKLIRLQHIIHNYDSAGIK